MITRAAGVLCAMLVALPALGAAATDRVLLSSPGKVPTIRVAAPAKRTGQADQHQATTDDGRIFGGARVSKGFAHWQVEIYRDFAQQDWDYHVATTHDTRPKWLLQHHCGGALIADDWVLTAAHCVLVVDPAKQASMMRAGFKQLRTAIAVSKENHISLAQCVQADQVDPEFRVRLGAEVISHEEGITYKIDCVVPHPDFSPASFYHNDIALLHLAADRAQPPRDPAKIQLIKLHTRSAPDRGTSVTVTGWGKNRPVPGHAPSAVLMQTALQINDGQYCARRLRVKPELVDDNVLCAGAAAQKTCLGDSGGPVVLTEGRPYYLVGIVSWGAADCKGDAAPGVYTRVGAYADWINDVMQAARD